MKITMANLHLATPQQVFTQVKQHLLKQNKRATGHNKKCMYRTSTGLKCAAGCLISDDEYKESFENIAWPTLCYEVHASENCKDLIGKLQIIHDAYPPADWPKKLKALAKEFYLKY